MLPCCGCCSQHIKTFRLPDLNSSDAIGLGRGMDFTNGKASSHEIKLRCKQTLLKKEKIPRSKDYLHFNSSNARGSISVVFLFCFLFLF